MLRSRGARVSLVHRTAAWRDELPKIAVFHRPASTLGLRLLLRWFRARGVICIAEVDDLIFDPELACFSPGVLNGVISLDQARAQFRTNRDALGRFDRISTSTEPLAAHLAEHFPHARLSVIPNAVSPSWGEFKRAQPAGAANGAPVIVYLPGTRSHDRDFQVYAEGTEAFLAAYPDARLEVTGPLRFRLRARPSQIVHREKVPFSQYHELVRSAWVNLAPLEATPFTRCKSALKIMEAGFWGVPTVCSPTPDGERFREAGALFAGDAEACFSRLETLWSPERYRSETSDLSRRVLERADAGRSADALLRLAGTSEATHC